MGEDLPKETMKEIMFSTEIPLKAHEQLKLAWVRENEAEVIQSLGDVKAMAEHCHDNFAYQLGDGPVHYVDGGKLTKYLAIPTYLAVARFFVVNNLSGVNTTPSAVVNLLYDFISAKVANDGVSHVAAVVDSNGRAFLFDMVNRHVRFATIIRLKKGS